MHCSVNGIDLHWEESGEGEPLLWLHGAMGRGADWRHVFTDPPPGFKVIAPDLRGHGASTNPERLFTFQQMARDVIALVRHLDLSRFKAIGLSGGGITMLHVARLEPSLVEAMVVVSAPPRFPDKARQIQKSLSPAAVGEAEMQRLKATHVHGDAQIAQLFDMVHAWADDRDDVNFTRETLAPMTAETLIVFGDRDFLYPVSLAFELHASIPGSHLWVVPNGGHGPVFGKDAALFAQTALAFLRGEW